MIFNRKPISTIIDEELYQARCGLIVHRAAAEYHSAMADMLAKRIDRLGELAEHIPAGAAKWKIKGPMMGW